MTVVDRAAPHRERLLLGMATAVAEKGYAVVTVADVVAAAGVSKRTFYEHFDSKEGCLLACYAEAAQQLVLLLRTAGRDQPPGFRRVRDSLADYLGALDLNRGLAVALLVEIQAAGAAGRRLRREKNLLFATAIRDLVAEEVAERGGVPVPGLPDLETFGPEQSIALVGGIHELILQHAESSPDVPFRTLAPAATRFVCAVLGVPVGD